MWSPKPEADFGAFALAFQGLPENFAKVEELRQALLDCLKRDKEEKQQPAIYRATSRIDEILYRQRKDALTSNGNRSHLRW
jgi:hypothetical protein